MVAIRQQTDIAGILPDSLSHTVRQLFRRYQGDIYELRLIRSRCVFAVTSEGLRFLRQDGVLTAAPDARSATVTEDELEEIVQRAIGYSGFAHEEELRSSFLTRGDGTRIGIAFSGGAGSLRAGAIHSVNVRLPVASAVPLPDVLREALSALSGGLLLVGAPNTGKTTLLRACCKFLGDGGGGAYRKVCVVDERMELAGNGAFDLGCCTDVIAGREKREALLTALRLLSPEVIVCDEIGSDKETESILEGLNSGVVFLASMHARDLTQLCRRGQFLRLFRENVFDRVAVLDPRARGRINRVYTYEEVADEIHWGGSPFLRGGADRGLCEYPAKAAGGPVGKAV